MNIRDSESKVIQSITRKLGIPNFLDLLIKIPMSQLCTILISVFKNKVASKTPRDLLHEYAARQEFFGTSSISQNELYDFVQICHNVVKADFAIVQTSPIAPLGLNSVLTKISQNNTLSSIRGSEVVSDLTSQLAIECAYRRRSILSRSNQDSKKGIVNLCTSGRVLRLQPFEKDKGYMQHFNIFNLCSGGRKTSIKGFVESLLKMHMSTLLNVIEALQKEGYKFNEIQVSLSDMRFLEHLITALDLPREVILRNSLKDDFNLFDKFSICFPREVTNKTELNSKMFIDLNLEDNTDYYLQLRERILIPLATQYPNVQFGIDFNRKSGLGYYPNLCFHIFAKDHTGRKVQLADGGVVDWSAKLLSDNREGMVISAIGSELIQNLFKVE